MTHGVRNGRCKILDVGRCAGASSSFAADAARGGRGRREEGERNGVGVEDSVPFINIILGVSGLTGSRRTLPPLPRESAGPSGRIA